MSDRTNYQRKGAAALSPERPALFFKYASGKTAISLDVLATVVTESLADGVPPTFLILCPNHNKHTWHDEITRCYPDWNVCDLDDVGAEDKPNVYIGLHSRLRHGHSMSRLRELGPSVVIFDESTTIKSHKAKVTKAAHELGDLYRRRGAKTYILSGRPNPESLTEVWSQLRFCFNAADHPLGSSFYAHLHRYFLKADYTYALRQDQAEQFHKLIRDHSVLMDDEDHEEFRRVTGDKKPEYALHQFEPTAEQRRLLDTLDTTWSLPLSAGGTAATDPLGDPMAGFDEYAHSMTLLMKRQQIASGFYYTGSSRTPVYLSEQPKVKALNELLGQLVTEDHDRVVVWYTFEASLTILLSFVHDQGVLQLYNAKLPDHLKAFANKRASDPTMSVLLTPLSMARGLNDMAGVSASIFYENQYKQEVRNQAEARVLGLRALHTEKPLRFHDLCGTDLLDTQIINMLWAKDLTPQRLQAAVHKLYQCD